MSSRVYDGKPSKVGCFNPFMIVWLAGWSAGTLFFDFACVYTFYCQMQAEGFPTTPGVITRSQLETWVDGDGDRHTRADIVYSYSLDGREFDGDSVRFGMGMDAMDPKELLREYPLGREVNVFYDPRDASRSALKVGVVAMDFFFPLFILPFNVVMLGVAHWTLPVRRWLGWRPANIRVSEAESGYRYRIYRLTPVQCGALAAGVVAFFSIFIVGISMMFVPAAPMLIGAWALVVVAAVGAAFWVRPTILEMDPFRDRLRLLQSSKELEASLANLISCTPSSSGGSLLLKVQGDGETEQWLLPTGTPYATSWLQAHLQSALGRPQ